jgi:AraC-like DNA-binding protein
MEANVKAVDENPPSYHLGYGVEVPLRVANLLLFTRRSKRTLQKSSLANLSHHRYVMVWVYETTGVVSLDGVGVQLSPGQGMLIQPYQFHHYFDIQKKQLLWLFMTFELARGEEVVEPLAFIRFKQDSVIKKLIHELLEFWPMRSERLALMECQNLMERLLIRLLYNVEPISAPEKESDSNTRGNSDPWFARAERVLLSAAGKSEGLDTVARRMGMGERMFRQRFKSVAGVSPCRYRTNYLLQQALRLMREDALSIGGIADRLGFGSAAVFTRFIKRETGMTPLSCRQSIRNGRLDAEITPQEALEDR